jgi:hypothetical protein
MNKPNLTKEQLDEVWFWVAGYGFTRSHPPDDHELTMLLEIARRESVAWHIQQFLKFASELEAA